MGRRLDLGVEDVDSLKYWKRSADTAIRFGSGLRRRIFSRWGRPGQSLLVVSLSVFPPHGRLVLRTLFFWLLCRLASIQKRRRRRGYWEAKGRTGRAVVSQRRFVESNLVQRYNEKFGERSTAGRWRSVRSAMRLTQKCLRISTLGEKRERRRVSIQMHTSDILQDPMDSSP